MALVLTVLGLGGFAATARADVVLNEVNCEGTDWVELVNTAAQPAQIGGWLLTDDPLGSTRADHRMHFGDPTEIPPNGALVVSKGSGGFAFGISCGGDTIRLADQAEAGVDEIAVPDLATPGNTWGRYPNGTGDWTETTPTQGSANEPAAGEGPPPDPAGWIFDPATVVEVGMELPPESIDALGESPDEYVDGSFSLMTTAGTYGPLQVGIRLKGGFGSLRPLSGKSAFKVKFSHSVPGQRLLGLKKLTLNNMVQDPSMIHEVLSYRVFREAGIAAPRTGYAYVRVNGDDYGLYLNLETPDEVMLRAWYESTQHLYEGEYGADAVPGGAQAFEVDEGSDADRADLEALIAAGVAPVGIWSEAIEPVLDLRQATRMWAIEKYVGHVDGYAGAITDAYHPNNYFLHSDVGGRFTFMPWGTDWTWRDRIPFDSHGGYLFHACLWNERCRGLYRDAVAEVSALASGLDLDALAVQTAQTLRPWQQSDPRREHSMDQIDAEVAFVRQFIAGRPADAAAWLDGPPARAETVPPFRVAIHVAPASRTRARRVRFRFKANRHGATFKCKLDRRRYAPCRSLVRLRVAPGPHRFRVRAASPQGEVARDKAKFVVVAKRRRGRGRGRGR